MGTPRSVILVKKLWDTNSGGQGFGNLTYAGNRTISQRYTLST